jgi:SSS family solute:Na+ symporter
MSSLSASSVLILTLVNPSLVVFGNVELNIMTIGILLGVLGLLVGQVIEKYFPVSKVKEEI